MRGWHVRLANGETRALSLDELAAGFQAGWISETTMVLRAGALQWAPLSALAGLDEPMEAIPNSLAPLALDTVDVDVDVDEEVNAFRPRRGRKVLGFVTALVVVAGLGYAGLRARPALQHALASAPPPPPPVQPVSIPPVPAPPPAAVATTVAAAVPNALPATAAVTKTKAGRPAVKRGDGTPRRPSGS